MNRYSCAVKQCTVIVLETGQIIRPCEGCEAGVIASSSVILTGDSDVGNEVHNVDQYQNTD